MSHIIANTVKNLFQTLGNAENTRRMITSTPSTSWETIDGSWGTPFRGMTKDQQQYYPTVVYMALSNGEVAQYVLRDVKNKLKDFPDARVYNNVD